MTRPALGMIALTVSLVHAAAIGAATAADSVAMDAAATINGASKVGAQEEVARIDAAPLDAARMDAAPRDFAPDAVDVKLRYQRRNDDSGLADVHLELRDGLSGSPLNYGQRRLAAWLQRPLPTLAEAEYRCSDKVRMLASPGPGRRATVDFNTFRLLTVNEDRTLTVINPFLAVNNAKLESIVTLPGDVGAVLQRRDAHEVWLAIPAIDQLLVIDTDTRSIRHTHRLEGGARPVALVEAGGSVWAAQAGRDGWLRFDQSVAMPTEVPAPRVHAMLSIPGATSPMGLADDGIVGLDEGMPIVHLAGQSIRSVIWSPLAQRLLASTEDGGLLWMDPTDGRVSQRLVLSPAIAMAVFDDGRYLLVASDDGMLRVIDVATGEVMNGHEMTDTPNGIGFTDGFAYLQGAGSAQMTLFSLADLRRGRMQPVKVSVGGVSGAVFRAETTGIAPIPGARLMTPMPDGIGMYVANPLDGQIYQYAEGMMAPAGSFSTYRRSPIALMLLDTGLEQIGPGSYRAVMRAPKAGRYELVLSGVEPRFASCRVMDVSGPADSVATTTAPRPQVRLLAVEQDAEGGKVRVKAQLLDERDQPVGVGVDLTLLAFDRRNGWQAIRPMQAIHPGIYEGRLDAPPATTLDLRVSSRAADLPFHAGGLGTYRTLDARGVPQ